MTKKPKST